MTLTITHAKVDAIPDNAADAAAGKVLPSDWNADHVVSGTADGARTQLTTDTTYYVSTTGNDTTGDGSVGTPWATIQHAVDHVMYNVTGQGVRVEIHVADGTYAENILLGDHQIFDSGLGGFGRDLPVLRFSSFGTPTNVVIAPTTLSPIYPGLPGVVIAASNAAWAIRGGVSVTIGASTNSVAWGAFNGGQLYLDGNFVVTDAIDSAFAAFFHSFVFVQGDTLDGGPAVLKFNSTVGTLAQVDTDSNVDFSAAMASMTFDVDPLFNGFLGGAFLANFGGNSNITCKCPVVTYSAGATHTKNSHVGSGNVVIDTSGITSIAKVTIDDGGRYNNALNLGSQPEINAPTFGANGAFGSGPEYVSGTSKWTQALQNNNFFWYDGPNDVLSFAVSNNGTDSLACIPALGVFGWSNDNSYAAGNPATGIGAQVVTSGFSQISAGVSGLGNGTQGDTSGVLLSDGNRGAVQIDFGAFPGTTDTTLAVSVTQISSGSVVECFIMPATTTDHSVDEHWLDPPEVVAGSVNAGVGFTIYAKAKDLWGGVTGLGMQPPDLDNLVYGKWQLGWRWS